MRFLILTIASIMLSLCNSEAIINRTSELSRNLGISISQDDINSTLNALTVANYLGFAAPGPVTDYVTVNGFRIKVTSANLDLLTLDNNNVCNLTMTMDAKADGSWNNGLVASLLGDFKVKATLTNVIMKVKLDIQPSIDGLGYYLVAIPVGWDAGCLSIQSATFKGILSIAEYLYNGNANAISHAYGAHILNQPIKLASVSVIYQNLPNNMMSYGVPKVSFANKTVFIGWQCKSPSLVPVIQLLFD